MYTVRQMDSYRIQAVSVLRHAEGEIHALIGAAAQARCYSDLPSLARMGEHLSIIANEFDMEASASVPSAPAAISQDEHRQATPPQDRAGKRTRQKQVAAGSYPRFVREGEVLVKIGWSQSKKSDYEHRAPITAVRAVVARLAELAKKSPEFTMEDLADVQPLGEFQVVPHYQTYLVLAWLRARAHVEQAGRKSYRVTVNELAQNCERSWKEMLAK